MKRAFPVLKTKTPSFKGLAFFQTNFLVARGGIEPPTQGFSTLR
jgi:hypothetical protein